MYLEYFDLSERPFSITPDPRFLYMSARHREALAHLLYGLGEGGGFVQLTGEVGTGKTTICRCLLEQVPDNVDLALVLNPKVTAKELIATVCDELGVSYPAETDSIKALTDTLNRYLLDAHARGRRTVLIIDEAQNLSADVLEQIRLLTNLETSTQKLLQIILIGQPELRDMLAREDMRQLSQRVTARYHLEPISRDEADAYIRHRLQICGNAGRLFSKSAVDRIQKLSGGIPRLINVLCDRAMLGAYVEGKQQVDNKVVRRAAKEVLAEERSNMRSVSSRVPQALAALLVMSLLVLGALAYIYQPWHMYGETVQAPVVLPDAVMQEEPVQDEGPVVDVAPAMSLDALRQELMAAVPEQQAEEIPLEVTPVPLESLLAGADSSWYRTAWAGLFALWAVELPLDVKPDFCNYALQYGLFCSNEQGNWNTVRQFGRPAILKLAAPDGTRVLVLLRQLDGQAVELVIDNEPYRTTIGQVDPFWYGEYTLMLQAPPAGRLFLKVGERSPDVAWLREQLEQVQGVKLLSTDPQLFDYPLQKQVLEFQRSRGLVADGVVGKHTLIHVNVSAGREGAPLLRPAITE
jgi:general secretion pathway protein A